MTTDLKSIQSTEDRQEGPRWFVSDGCRYDRHDADVTLRIDVYEGEKTLELDCEGPHPDHWLGYALDADNLTRTLGFHCAEDLERFIAENSLVEGAPFAARLDWHFYRGDGWTTDDDWEIEVTVIAAVSTAPVAPDPRWDPSRDAGA